MKLNEVKYDRTYYPAESWNTLTEEQQVYIGPENKVWPPVEQYSKYLKQK